MRSGPRGLELQPYYSLGLCGPRCSGWPEANLTQRTKKADATTKSQNLQIHNIRYGSFLNMTAVKWYQARYLRWCNWALRSVQIYSQNPHHHLPSSNPLIHIPRVQPRVDPRDKSFLSKSMNYSASDPAWGITFTGTRFGFKLWFHAATVFPLKKSQNRQHSYYEFCGGTPGRIAALIWG